VYFEISRFFLFFDYFPLDGRRRAINRIDDAHIITARPAVKRQRERRTLITFLRGNVWTSQQTVLSPLFRLIGQLSTTALGRASLEKRNGFFPPVKRRTEEVIFRSRPFDTDAFHLPGDSYELVRTAINSQGVRVPGQRSEQRPFRSRPGVSDDQTA